MRRVVGPRQYKLAVILEGIPLKDSNSALSEEKLKIRLFIFLRISVLLLQLPLTDGDNEYYSCMLPTRHRQHSQIQYDSLHVFFTPIVQFLLLFLLLSVKNSSNFQSVCKPTAHVI